jgi:hypothetical protein
VGPRGKRVSLLLTPMAKREGPGSGRINSFEELGGAVVSFEEEKRKREEAEAARIEKEGGRYIDRATSDHMESRRKDEESSIRKFPKEYTRESMKREDAKNSAENPAETELQQVEEEMFNVNFDTFSVFQRRNRALEEIDSHIERIARADQEAAKRKFDKLQDEIRIEEQTVEAGSVDAARLEAKKRELALLEKETKPGYVSKTNPNIRGLTQKRKRVEKEFEEEAKLEQKEFEPLAEKHNELTNPSPKVEESPAEEVVVPVENKQKTAQVISFPNERIVRKNPSVAEEVALEEKEMTLDAPDVPPASKGATQPISEAVPPRVISEEPPVVTPTSNVVPISSAYPVSGTSVSKVIPAKKKAVRKTYRAAVVDADSLVESQARDVADHRMTESQEDRSGFFLKRFAKRIWKHNLAQEYYRQKELQSARKDIRSSENLYSSEEGEEGRASHQIAMKSIVDRFTTEYGEAALRNGEQLERADGPTNESIKRLITSFASDPHMTADAFQEERNRILSRLDESYAQEGRIFADNLLQIATEVRSAVAQGTALEALDFDVSLTLGKARESLTSEAKLNTFDRITEKFQNSRIGRFVANEPAAMLAAAGVYAGAKAVGLSALRSNVAKLFTFGGTALLAGGITAFKESARLERERNQHMREYAKGKTVSGEGMKRRNEMDLSRYEMTSARVHATELQTSLAALRTNPDDVGARNRAIATLADLESRISLGDRERIDLISYSSATTVETERTQLDLLRAELKARLRTGGDISAELTRRIEARTNALVSGDEGVEAKNRVFSKMKRRKVAKAALITVGVGVGVGIAAQEVVSAFDDSQTGLIDHARAAFGGTEARAGGHATALESLRRFMFDGGDPRVPLGKMHEVRIGETRIRLPESVDLTKGSDGTYTLLRDGEPVAENLSLSTDATGNLTDASTKALGEYGVRTNFGSVEGAKMVERSMSPAEYLKGHTEGTHRIHRELWYDNNTPHPFDKNELRTHWGGEKGTGVDTKGNFVMDIQRMRADGSYHNGMSADAKKLLAEGKLKVLFSLSRSTQHQPFDVSINKDGTITILKDSPLAKLMFENRHGQAIFKGQFAEIAESRGIAPDGGENVRVLSTVVGSGRDSIMGSSLVQTHIPQVRVDVPDTQEFDPPLIFPFRPRRPLERSTASDGVRSVPGTNFDTPKAFTFGYPTYGSTESIDEEFKNITRDSYVQTIENGRKVWRDAEGKEVERNVEREQKRIREYIAAQDPVYRAELDSLATLVGPMHPKCRLSVIIPARFEEPNLSNLLTQYAKQIDEQGKPLDPDLYEINIIVNRKQGETPDKSMEVIAEWKKENPSIHVNAIDKEFSPQQANVGTARKYITDLALLRSVTRSTAAGPLYIESEDADLISLDRRTVSKLVRNFDSEPQLDILRGIQDRQPEVLRKNHLLFFERRVWDFMEVFMRRQAYRPENMENSSFVWNRVISGGWNTAYTAESYTQIGGYVPDLITEDMKIGWKISYLRGQQNEKGEFVLNTQTVKTSGLRASSSPRRFLDAMNRNIAPYADFEDQSLKSKTLNELLDGVKEYAKASPEQIEAYNKALTTARQFLSEQMPAPQFEAVFERTTRAMGLKKEKDYAVKENNEVELSPEGMNKIISLFELYDENKRHLEGYKRQSAPDIVTK